MSIVIPCYDIKNSWGPSLQYIYIYIYILIYHIAYIYIQTTNDKSKQNTFVSIGRSYGYSNEICSPLQAWASSNFFLYIYRPPTTNPNKIRLFLLVGLMAIATKFALHYRLEPPVIFARYYWFYLPMPFSFHHQDLIITTSPRPVSLHNDDNLALDQGMGTFTIGRATVQSFRSQFRWLRSWPKTGNASSEFSGTSAVLLRSMRCCDTCLDGRSWDTVGTGKFRVWSSSSVPHSVPICS